MPQDEPTYDPEAPAVEEEQDAAVDERDEGVRQWQPRLYLTIILLALLVAYGIAFVLENNKEVSLHFVLATAHVSLIWLILLSVALGLVLGVLLSKLHRRRRRHD
jgi:uncharacterized integral membrane protein